MHHTNTHTHTNPSTESRTNTFYDCKLHRHSQKTFTIKLKHHKSIISLPTFCSLFHAPARAHHVIQSNYATKTNRMLCLRFSQVYSQAQNRSESNKWTETATNQMLGIGNEYITHTQRLPHFYAIARTRAHAAHLSVLYVKWKKVKTVLCIYRSSSSDGGGGSNSQRSDESFRYYLYSLLSIHS